MKKILAIIGARPQFIKHAPIEIAAHGKLDLIAIHTGQHYDENMSAIFFDQLKMESPKYNLNIGSYSHGVQTGKMMEALEPIFLKENPAAILVYGDTNSTLAGALVGSKLHIPVIHVEAGLRSFNKQMPEEINRILTDHISSLLFVPTDGGKKNLEKEGITKNVFKVGDVMCDMVQIALGLGTINPSSNRSIYYYATIHRPYNTDNPNRLKYILDSLNQLNHKVKLALHPRTKNRMKNHNLLEANYNNIQFLSPVSFFENIGFQANSQAVITDSGGMQKEAYILRKRCITIRKETEWLETLENGWNTLAFQHLNQLNELMEKEIGLYKKDIYGKGNTAKEIIDLILQFLERN